jgi:thiamine kinase-like enzyme
MTEYFKFSPLGKVFILISARFKKEAFTIFPATTFKKKLIFNLFKLLLLWKIHFPWIAKANNFELIDGFNVDDLLKDVFENSELSLDVILVMWNREYSRKRVYIWLIDSKTEKRFFIKVAAGKLNQCKLENESRILSHLELGENAFSYPKKIFCKTHNNISVLMTEAIPLFELSFKPLDKDLLETRFFGVNDYLASNVNFSEVRQMEWFKIFSDNESDECLDLVTKALEKHQSYRVGFAHGDLGSENSFLYNNDLWLIDWENSGFDLPILTDRVAHAISELQAKDNTLSLSDTGESIFIPKEAFDEHVLLALIYLLSNKFELARPYLHQLIR